MEKPVSAVKATAPIFILLLGAYFSVMAFAEYADCRAFSAANNAAATEISEASLRIVAPLDAAALVMSGFLAGRWQFR